MSWTLVEENSGGWKKFRDQWGNFRYQRPDGRFGNKYQWAASHTHHEPQEERDTIVSIQTDRLPEDTERIETHEITTEEDARRLLESLDYKVYQWQTSLFYVCAGDIPREERSGIVHGSSKWSDDHTKAHIMEDVIGEFEGETLVETMEISDPGMRRNQAFSHAYALIPCSPEEIEVIEHNLRVHL